MRRNFKTMKDLVLFMLETGYDYYQTGRYVYHMIVVNHEHWILTRRVNDSLDLHLAWSEVAHIYTDKIVLWNLCESEQQVIYRK